ncbi:MAG: hypothetical protein ACLTTU_14970 [Bilophila wadsworthia]
MTQTRNTGSPPARADATHRTGAVRPYVTATLLVINWNRRCVRPARRHAEQYEKLVVQEEDVPAIKSEMAG